MTGLLAQKHKFTNLVDQNQFQCWLRFERFIVHKIEMDVISDCCNFENKIIAQTRVLQESLVA